MFLCGNRPLLDAFRRGDREALAQVYDHYYPSVVELAASLLAIGGARYDGTRRSVQGRLA